MNPDHTERMTSALRNVGPDLDVLGAIVDRKHGDVHIAPVRIWKCDPQAADLGTAFIHRGVWFSAAGQENLFHPGAILRVQRTDPTHGHTLTLRHDTPLPFLDPNEHEDVLLNALWALLALPSRPYFPWEALERAVARLENHPVQSVRREAQSASVFLATGRMSIEPPCDKHN